LQQWLERLERDDFIFESSSRSMFCLSTIFLENRRALFRIMLYRAAGSSSCAIVGALGQ
jgi:hypothetical protein